MHQQKRGEETVQEKKKSFVHNVESVQLSDNFCPFSTVKNDRKLRGFCAYCTKRA